MSGKTTSITLNKEQLKAVTHKDGPLLIIAGAGTGKTTVITERIKWLIEQKHAPPNQILALTFTDKSAREMEERVDIALPFGLTQMWITTFHAFGDRVLRDEAVSIGLDPGYRLMTEAESVIFFRSNLFKFDLEYYRPLGNPQKFIEAILRHFSRLKDEDVSPAEYLKWVSNLKPSSDDKDIKKKYLELADTYQKYEGLKIKEGMMDFSDLISNSLLLLRKRQNILNEYRQKFKYILIDEFQDTNFAQNELAILLSGEKANITVVGDDDQAIYRFRGAAVSNIIQFKKRFPGTKIIVLNQNYRSTKTILEASYQMIQNNNPDRLEVKEKINKKLVSARKITGKPIEYIYQDRVENEAEEVARMIKKIKDEEDNATGEKKYNYSEFAVLIRANQHADPFIRAFHRLGIPYQFLGPGRLFRQSEVKDLIAYLKFLVNQDDSVALFRVLNLDIFNLPIRDLASLLNFSKRVGVSLYDGLEIIVAHDDQKSGHWSQSVNYSAYLPMLSENSKNTYKKISVMIENHLKLAKKDSAGQILYSFLEQTGLLQKFTKFESIKEEREVLNISKFFDRLKNYEVDHEDASIYTVADWIDMSMELGESPLAADTDWVKNDAVNILTVHSAKGLEFPVVFLVNLVAERFPTRERSEKIPLPDELIKEILPVGDYHMEEERRLFYVGLTRARDRLILTASSYYGQAKRARKISPFVVETIGNEVLSIVNKAEQKQSSQLPLLEWKKEKDEIKKQIALPVKYLSFSRINTYLTCPLQYKYRYVLNIPVPASAVASFGSSIHLVLQKFYELHKEGRNLNADILIKIFEKAWIPLGYQNKKYEEKMKARGRDMLRLFFEKAYKKNTKVDDLEKLFRIKLSGNLMLGGKIDRIDRLNDGRLEIIDYKTGKIQKDKDIKNNLQMTVYALAAADKGIYGQSPDKVIMSFYFLESGQIISSPRSQADLTKAKEKIINLSKEISSSEFVPKVGPWCDFCDFRLICEAWQ